MGSDEPGMSNDEWQRLRTQMDETKGGQRMAASAPEPSVDPNEKWSELAPLKKVSPGAAFDLVEELRKAGIPVRSPGARSAGVFSGGKVNVTFSVPDRLQAEATRIIARYFPDWLAAGKNEVIV